MFLGHSESGHAELKYLQLKNEREMLPPTFPMNIWWYQSMFVGHLFSSFLGVEVELVVGQVHD